MKKPFKAKRIRNGKYIYRGFSLEKEDGRQSWLATKESYKVGPCYSFERLKYQVDIFLQRKYRIMLDPNVVGHKEGTAEITEEGALIIWSAYKAKFPKVSQTMDTRNGRGGICWLSEIEGWKRDGYLPKEFEWKKYVISN